nr:uncharacterized protein LOC128689774 [Cherax quadricarinatus]
MAGIRGVQAAIIIFIFLLQFHEERNQSWGLEKVNGVTAPWTVKAQQLPSYQKSKPHYRRKVWQHRIPKQKQWHTALIVALLSGDIQINPGPQTIVQRQNRQINDGDNDGLVARDDNLNSICNAYIGQCETIQPLLSQTLPNRCIHCTKVRMKNRKGTLCKMCKGWVHDGCMYNYSNGARIHFVCNKCTLAQLPFSSDDIDLPNFNTNDPLPYIDDHDCFMKTGLHFIHVNARSLLPKLAEIRILANKIRAAVITISESWLDDTVTDDEVKLEGYNIKRLDRNRKGGGVCAYIRNDLAYNPRPDLNNNKLEILWFEVLLPKTKPILVGTSYRPPTQDQFLEDFSRVLSGVESNCETIILGDFNICFQQQNNGLCKRYKQILGLNSYTQLINKPTRITQFSATLIDHILCNRAENISQSGIITTGLSDHFIIYCTRKITRDRIGLHRTIKMRSTRNYSKETLVNRLHNCDWTEITSCTDVNDAWEKFKTMFTTILNNIAPVKIR